jgi:hypothetical protein
MQKIDFKTSLASSEKFFSRAGGDPRFDWGIILAFSCAVAGVFVWWSVGLFMATTADLAAPAAAEQTSATAPSSGSLNIDDMTNLVGIFQEKKTEESAAFAPYAGPSDPAIPARSAPPSIPVKSPAQ